MKIVLWQDEPLATMAAAKRGDCVEVRGFRSDYFVRAIPERRRWVLEIARNRYLRHSRDAFVAQRRRRSLARMGWNLDPVDPSIDAVATCAIEANDPAAVWAVAERTLELFGDEPQEVEIEDRARRCSPWPDVPFSLIWWDRRQNPAFDLVNAAVRRLEGTGRRKTRVYWAEPRSSCFDDILYLVSPRYFDHDEADQVWFDLQDEMRDGLADGVDFDPAIAWPDRYADIG